MMLSTEEEEMETSDLVELKGWICLFFVVVCLVLLEKQNCVFFLFFFVFTLCHIPGNV